MKWYEINAKLRTLTNREVEKSREALIHNTEESGLTDQYLLDELRSTENAANLVRSLVRIMQIMDEKLDKLLERKE